MYVHEDALRHLYENPYVVIHLQPSLLTFLRNAIILSSLLVSLQSNLTLTSLLTSLWKICLLRLYEDIPTITPIPSKPEIVLQYTWGFVIIPEQVKPDSPES